MTEAADLGPLPEPPSFYRYQFDGPYGPIWRSSSQSWHGLHPIASDGLYTAAQMEAERRRCFALGAERERERCAKIVDMPPNTEAWEVIGGEDGLTMLRELANQIREGSTKADMKGAP